MPVNKTIILKERIFSHENLDYWKKKKLVNTYLFLTHFSDKLNIVWLLKYYGMKVVLQEFLLYIFSYSLKQEKHSSSAPS